MFLENSPKELLESIRNFIDTFREYRGTERFFGAALTLTGDVHINKYRLMQAISSILIHYSAIS